MNYHGDKIAPPVPDNNNLGEFTCIVCQKAFPSRQQQSVHAFAAHGVKDVIGLYVNTTHCIICLKEFHTRARLLQHIAYRSDRTNICRLNYFDTDPVLTIGQRLFF